MRLIALNHNLSVIVEVHDKKEAELSLKYDQQLLELTKKFKNT